MDSALDLQVWNQTSCFLIHVYPLLMLAPGYHNTWYICKLVGWLAAGAAAAPERPDTADQLLGGPIELWGQLGSAAMVAVLAAVRFSTRCSSNALRQLDQIDQ